jgi:signal transduction histidine kinase
MSSHDNAVGPGESSAPDPGARPMQNAHRVQESSPQLKAVSRVSAALASLSDLQAILRVGLDSVCDLLGAKCGAVLLADEESSTLVLRVGRDWESRDARLAPGVIESAAPEAEGESADRGLAGRVLSSGRALLVEDLAREDDLRDEGLATGELSPGQTGFFAGVPLCSRHRVLGVLEVSGETPRRFSSEERYALTSIGELLGVAVDRAEVLEQLSRGRETYQRLARYCLVAQDEERRRIARELHDETSQSISALALNLRALVEVAEMSGLSPELVERLKKVESLAQETGYELTRIINDLRPGLLDSAGLVAAIRRFAHDHLEAQDVKVDVQVKGTFPRLAPEIEANLFRFAQGAITNIARHAEAHSVSITLECSPERLVMQIKDDGRGFDISEITGIDEKTGRGRGLFAMKERIRLLGGSCSVGSAPGEGTTVRAEVPLKEAGDV